MTGEPINLARLPALLLALEDAQSPTEHRRAYEQLRPALHALIDAVEAAYDFLDSDYILTDEAVAPLETALARFQFQMST